MSRDRPVQPQKVCGNVCAETAERLEDKQPWRTASERPSGVLEKPLENAVTDSQMWVCGYDEETKMQFLECQFKNKPQLKKVAWSRYETYVLRKVFFERREICRLHNLQGVLSKKLRGSARRKKMLEL